VGLAGLQYGLLAYDAVAFNFPPRKPGVGNVPMPAKQLDGVFTLILDGYPVSKNIMILAGAGIRWLVFRLHTHFDSLRNSRYHTTKNINFFLFQNLNPHLIVFPLKFSFFCPLT
jgi:hypothetical protein